jgi:hypothetical protein
MGATADDMTWADVPERLDEWALCCAAPSADLKKTAADIYTRTSIGYYYQPDAEVVAVHAPQASEADFLRCKSAACRAAGRDSVLPVPLPDDEAASGRWIKVAYSPTVRTVGELLNFFPGDHTGIPNAPSPLAAMLTTALVGGGLGYGAGRLAENVLPLQKGKARKSMGIGGALAGAALVAPWAIANVADKGRSGLTDPSPFDGGPEPKGDPHNYPLAFSSGDYGKSNKKAIDLDAVELGGQYKKAVATFVKTADTFGNFRPRPAPSALDVNIDAMGRTLWDTGASPALAASTMSALYAAQQMPDPRAQQGMATGHQLGQLAMNAGKDYVTGALVGAALNRTLGLPITANQAGLGNLVLGLIGAAVPKLFG